MAGPLRLRRSTSTNRMLFMVFRDAFEVASGGTAVSRVCRARESEILVELILIFADRELEFRIRILILVKLILFLLVAWEFARGFVRRIETRTL